MESRSSVRLRTRASAAYLHYGSEFPLARLRLGLAAIQGPGALQPVLWGIPGSILGPADWPFSARDSSIEVDANG